MPPRHALFVDTSAFFASSQRRDRNFPVAQRVLASIARQQLRLVTTSYVVVEAHGLFLARVGRDAGVEFLRQIDAGAALVVSPIPADETRARDVIYRYNDKEFSLCDAISFAVMERLGITTAFTFDSDFHQYGFAIAQP